MSTTNIVEQNIQETIMMTRMLKIKQRISQIKINADKTNEYHLVFGYHSYAYIKVLPKESTIIYAEQSQCIGFDIYFSQLPLASVINHPRLLKASKIACC